MTPRPFTEVAAIYGPDMSGIWSGGIVYEWSQQDNSYGLVQIDANGNVTPLTDYQNLKAELAKVSPKSVTMDSYSSSAQASQCPAQNENWQASSNLPPTPSEGGCKCMTESLTCTANPNTLSAGGNDTLIGDQLNYLCSNYNCSDISADGSKGIYGAFSFCTPQDKLKYMYNFASAGDSSKCIFDGHAIAAQPSQSDLQSCSKIKATSPNTGVNGGKVNSSSTSTSNSIFHQLNFSILAALSSAPLILNAVQNFM